MPESSRLLTESEYRYIINNLGSGGSSSPVSAEAIIVTIPTTGWSETFPYTITLPADGAVDSNSPIFYLYTTGETATDEELAGVKLITDMSTTTNYVRITASKVPTSSFKIALYGLASGTEVEGDLSEKYNILSGKVNDLETLVSGLEEVDNELNDAISEVAELANEASTIAKGRNRARVFATTEDMNAWLSDSTNAGQAIVGDNLYIVELEVPDWWISEVLTETDSETGFYYKIAQLETQKVDLTTIESDISDLKNKDAEIEAAIDDAQTLTHVSGTIAVVEDSAEDSLLNLKLFGKTEQFSTTGAQLLDTSDLDVNEISDITCTVVGDGGIYVNGTKPTGNWKASIQKIVTLDSGIYVLSHNGSKGNLARIRVQNKSDTTSYKDYSANAPFTIDNTTQDAVFMVQVDPGWTINETIYPMLNAGSSPLPWEPYTGGMPAPNPSYPQELVSVGGDGEIGVSVCGKNLLENTATSKTVNGVTFTVNSDGSVTANGTATGGNADLKIGSIDIVSVLERTFIIDGVNGSQSTYYIWGSYKDANGNDSYFNNYGGSTTVTLDENATKLHVYVGVREGVTASNIVFKPMVRLASIADGTYEPYKLTTLPISISGSGLPGIPVTDASLANYTDADGKMWCCDEVDLERGKYVKRIGSTVLNGTESWSKHSVAVGGGNQYFYSFNGGQKAFTDGTHGNFSHFRTGWLGSSDGNGFVGANTIQVRLDSVSSAADLKTWFSSNNTTVQFILTTPVETDLTADQIKAYRAILTKNPTTTIFTDVGAYFEADVVRESETAKLVKTKINRTPNIFYGTTEPRADLGKDGDLYFMYEEE